MEFHPQNVYLILHEQNKEILSQIFVYSKYTNYHRYFKMYIKSKDYKKYHYI